MTIGKKLTNCQVYGYINDWDKPMAATVPAGAILRGFQSEHNNHKELVHTHIPIQSQTHDAFFPIQDT